MNTNFKYDNTMVMIGRMYAHTPGTPGGNGITSILCANGLENNVNVLTRGDLIWLLSQAVSLGQTMGIREERTRRRNGKQKNNNR